MREDGGEDMPESIDSFPVVGELHEQQGFPDSPFKNFFWDGGIDGLAYVEGQDLHILAIHAATSGIGQSREFIRQCKGAYRFIRIWCVMNEDMPTMLHKYGFTPGHDTDKFGQMQEVWDWTAAI